MTVRLHPVRAPDAIVAEAERKPAIWRAPALMKAEMKWTVSSMYRDVVHPLHPDRVLAQDTGVLRAHLQRYRQIAEHFDQRRAGLTQIRAHHITGTPAAAHLNDNEAVVHYEAVLDNMETLLSDAVELHELRT